MARAIEEQGYTGRTVIKAAGITYRQLDYWARQGIVTPSIRDATGSGSQRLYSFGDVVRCRLIKKLLDTGVSLTKIRRSLDYLRTELQRPLEDVYLASDGRTVYAITSPSEVIDLLARGQGVFAIAVGKIYEELQGKVAEFRKPVTEEAGPDEGAEAHGG